MARHGSADKRRTTMSTETNKSIVRRYVEEVQNQGNLTALDELTAPAYVNHSAPPGVPLNREGLKQLATMFREAFPDGQMTIEDMVAEADRVATRKTFRGTHRGELMGIQGTGKTVAIGLMDIARLADGKVVETWHAGDDLGLLQQIGALQPPTSANR
jgi:predicted ester cyclase